MSSKIIDEKVRQGAYKLLAELFMVLSNPDRLEILDLLSHNPPASRSFSTIMFSVHRNPNVVNRHLNKLGEYSFVRKTEDGNYQITETGKLALSATSSDILEIVDQSLSIARKERIIPE